MVVCIFLYKSWGLNLLFEKTKQPNELTKKTTQPNELTLITVQFSLLSLPHFLCGNNTEDPTREYIYYNKRNKFAFYKSQRAQKEKKNN
jgi:hypothetical protein